MATDTSQLQGEIETIPEIPPADVERLLKDFLNALLKEASPEGRAEARAETAQ